MAEYHQQSPPQGEDPQGSGTPEDGNQNGKRKRNEDGPQQRSKRNRYISIACNECKRRKIKCNGEHPCQRCGNLSLECVYAPNCCSNNWRETQEYKQLNAHVQYLQEQVNSLWNGLNNLRTSLGQDAIPQPDLFSYGGDVSRSVQPPQANMIIDPSLGREPTSPQDKRYQGPTSPQYNFDLARSSLQSMGITTSDETLANAMQGSHSQSNPTLRPESHLHPSVQPITEIKKDEGLRLCRVYEDEMGLMYPILDINRVSQHATLVFALGEAVQRSGNTAFGGPTEMRSDADMEILKLVMANALVAESGGRSTLAKRLYNSCARSTEVGLQEEVTLKNIQIMTLVAMYLFHSDQETRSWRVIGIAARLCVELGLHRSETYSTLFRDEDERDAALRVFWSVYVLDKRWSLGTGMASALSDSDIDQNLEKPYSSPYLACMVDYSKIGSEVWSTFGNKDYTKTEFDRSKAEYLNYQVLQWYKGLPSFLQYRGPRHPDYAESMPAYDSSNTQQTRPLYRLQLILYLRANQMRTLIYRPVLHSANRMLSSDIYPFSQKVVDIGRDTIRLLSKISQESDIYHTQQMSFNYFLATGLGVLFLAVAHAPAEFAASCRDEFYMALDLVRGMSSQSVVSERLWKTIKGFKEIGPKLGLYQRNSDIDMSNGYTNSLRGQQQSQDSVQSQHDAASSAAMAMAGLRAGRPVDESDFWATQQGNGRPVTMDGRNAVETQSSPNGMANDLMSLFEAAGAFANGAAPGQQAFEGRAQMANMGVASGAAGQGMAGGHEDDFGRIVRELF